MKSRSPQFFASSGTREVTCGKVTPWSNDAATTGYHCPPLASMTRIDCLFHLCVLPGARTTEVTDRTYTIRWPGPKSGGHRQEACGSAESGRQSNKAVSRGVGRLQTARLEGGVRKSDLE